MWNIIDELLSIKLLPLNKIKQSEEHDEARVRLLTDNIKDEGIWTHPILVEKQNFIIMDGHHRYQVAKNLNFKRIPCFVLRYDNPYLTVSSRIENLDIQINNIINAGLTGNLLKYKSTKHELLIDLLQVRIPIEILEKKYE